MWRSLLLHEFPNGDVRNFSAVDGLATALPPDVNAIGPDDRFEYTLSTPLPDVIGLSCRVRFRVPAAAGAFYRIARFDSSAEFGIELDVAGIEGGLYPDLDPDVAAPYRLFLRLGPSASHRGIAILDFNTFVDFRFDWHTSGQARLFINGAFAAYDNAFATGSSIPLSALAIGRGPPNPNLPDVAPDYGITRFFVRALRRLDALTVWSRLLPDTPVTDDPVMIECRAAALDQLMRTVQRLRPFMAMFHHQTSTPWSLDTGDPQGPFSGEATAAHTFALSATSAVVSILRRMDFSHTENFLQPFEAFLRTIHDALPAEFEALAQELLSSSDQLGDECGQVLIADQRARGAEVEPIMELLQGAVEILERVAVGQ